MIRVLQVILYLLMSGMVYYFVEDYKVGIFMLLLVVLIDIVSYVETKYERDV